MSAYHPPLDDMKFVLEHVVGLARLPQHPDLGAITPDVVESILEPAAQLASEVLAPLNAVGDKKGCVLKNGEVTSPPGFKDAYAQYRDGGWNAVPFGQAHGGQGLPWLLAFAVQEMWQGANMAFGLCPLLNQGAIEAIENHAAADLKSHYLDKLISGEWTGTMNLTEPQAGSDLSAIRAKAERHKDGTYRIFGQKIFITYGEHDFAENIIHLVLARLPDAPEGVKGISLFIVPKFLNDGTRNDLICAGIEHKLGIHASPTCTMQFGDKGGAIGFLVGKENEGLKYMFTMMNNARLSVGLQGVSIAEAALQKAEAYAADRIQGAGFTDKTKRVPIAEHPDVKRMLLSMRAQTEAARALTYEAALCIDLARKGDAAAQMKMELLTPVVKAWGTDVAQAVAYLGVQIHGGMGFIEEAGAAQFLRDARILPIYEGTNGIQANDLVFRKLARDQGAAAKAFFAEIPPDIRKDLGEALIALESATDWMVKTLASDPEAAALGAVSYLQAFGIVAGGVMMARSAKAANGASAFAQRKQATARFYKTQILPFAVTHAKIAQAGR